MTRAAGKFGSFALPGDGTNHGRASALVWPHATPASRLTPVDVVRARVTTSIALGVLSPGERLPDPEALAGSLDVSPITVRRALESMCRDGLLERRRGRTGGTFVSSDPDPTHLAGAAGRQDTLAELRTAAEQRLVVECGIVALVAAAAPAAQALRDVLTTPADGTGPTGLTATVSTETSFHGRLAALTGLAGATPQVHDAIFRVATHLPSTDQVPTAVIVKDHEAIIDALADADGTHAVRLMRDHLDRLHRLSPAPTHLTGPPQVLDQR